MKQLFLFLLAALFLNMGFAQGDMDIHSYEVNSKRKEIKHMTHEIQLPTAELEIQLKGKSIKIGEENYEVMLRRGKYYLLDADDRFQAIWYSNTIMVGDQKYKIRRGKLINMADPKQPLARISLDRRRKINSLHITPTAEIPTMVLALLFHQQIESMTRGDGTDMVPYYQSWASSTSCN